MNGISQTLAEKILKLFKCDLYLRTQFWSRCLLAMLDLT